MVANNVSSLPTMTLLPGLIWVPCWRTRMFPARTNSPPYFFTPRRCPWLSRPLRLEPPPFLCAIVYLLLLGDRIDANFSILLAVTRLGADALLGFISEHDDLGPFDLFHDCCLNFCTFYQWG